MIKPGELYEYTKTSGRLKTMISKLVSRKPKAKMPTKKMLSKVQRDKEIGQNLKAQAWDKKVPLKEPFDE